MKTHLNRKNADHRAALKLIAEGLNANDPELVVTTLVAHYRYLALEAKKHREPIDYTYWADVADSFEIIELPENE